MHIVEIKGTDPACSRFWNTSHEATSDVQCVTKSLFTNKLFVDVGQCGTVRFSSEQPNTNALMTSPTRSYCPKNTAKSLVYKYRAKLNVKDHISYVTNKLNTFFCGLMYVIRETFPIIFLLMFHRNGKTNYNI